jgi:hypothetical protein
MPLAANALTTLQTVLDELSLTGDGSSQDARLIRYINAASTAIESYCNRSFYRESAKVEKVAGYRSVILQVSKRPLNSIASITFDGDTVDSDNYEIHGNGDLGQIYGVGGWLWTAVLREDIVSAPMPGSERLLYEVTYDGGYYTPEQGAGTPALPDDLEDACIQMVTGRWQSKGRDPNLKSEKLTTWAATYDNDPSGIPANVRLILDRYAEVAMA